MGSVVYGTLFRNMPYRTAFLIMGSIVTASSLLSVFIRVPCHAGMLWGEDNHAVIQARQRFLLRKEIERVHQHQSQPDHAQEHPLEGGDADSPDDSRMDVPRQSDSQSNHQRQDLERGSDVGERLQPVDPDADAIVSEGQAESSCALAPNPEPVD
jgi:hypothetical protein